ncbi:intraflagellar transport protein 20 homolog isoform X2 [Ictalurus furcatus]|uniref:intraflagellar transport protein 20 homolog isoform X2 n=1 Tax=Ictalurus furcatus TaxID=66913 RepID=UPI00235105C4|nr:intraflagellar transport protein 20 homolog isoform X2 [Ictalurus furcatus]
MCNEDEFTCMFARVTGEPEAYPRGLGTQDPEQEIVQFQKIVGGLIEMVDELAKEAEREKMKAIGARNLLKSVAKQREAQQQQLQALIAEKRMQLERYRIEYEALSKVEAEQNEFIDQFMLQK